MLASVILNGLKNLSAGEELTAKKIVLWIIGAMEITDVVNIPDFTIASTGRIKNKEFWTHLQSQAKISLENVDLSLKNLKYEGQMYEVSNAVGSVFDATIEWENIFPCWLQISQFLFDLQKTCVHGIFMVTSVRISATLLNKFVDITDFDQSQTIMNSILLGWKCCAGLAAVVAQVRDLALPDLLRNAFVNTFDEVFDLIGKNLIFSSSNALFEYTAIMLKKAIIRLDFKQLTKYLNAVSFALESEAENMVEYCTSPEPKRHWVNILTIRTYATSCHRQLTLQILEMLLHYSRKNNIPFNCDWTQVFAFTLHSTDDEIKKASMELFLLEAQRTDENEPANQYTLLEKAIRAHRLFNDESEEDFCAVKPLFCCGHRGMGYFFGMFKSHFTCDKLFYLLRKHVENDPAMCIVVIQIINHTAEIFAREPLHHDRHLNLVKEVFRHVECVMPYPPLLYRLINIVDLSMVENYGLSHEQIASLIVIVAEAFLQCTQYGTAVALLEILKKLEFSDYISLIPQLLDLVPGHIKEFLVLFLAADEAFDIFKLVHPEDRSVMYKFFKRGYHHAANDELKSLYFALIVNMLAAFNLTPEKFANMISPNIIPTEAALFYNDLFDIIVSRKHVDHPFASIVLGNAVCVYSVSFNRPTDGPAIRRALMNLASASCHYYHSYERVAAQDETKDLRLITKFWKNAIKFYETEVRYANEDLKAIPGGIFEYYPFVHDHLVDLVEKFIGSVLRFQSDLRLYDLFAETICDCVKYTKPVSSVMPLVKKLFDFVGNTELDFTLSTIAAKVFLTNIDCCTGSERPKTIWSVQAYLYRIHMQANNRDTVFDALKSKIDSYADAASVERKNLEAFLQYLQENVIQSINEAQQHNDDDVDDDDDSELPPPPKRRRGKSSGRRSDSLVPINESIEL